jgi:nicotinamide phosphoribosyltransferase
MNFLEIYWTDVYKTGHKFMLPPGSTLMYSNFTPRSGKYSNCPNNGKIVSFGQQMLVQKIKEDWDNNFFKRDISEIDQFGQDMTDMLMLKQPYDVSHFKDLHKLGYLPLEMKAIEEGNLIPYKIPLYDIVNTKPISNEIYDWLVNYLETILSAEAWQAPTSATLSYSFRQLGKEWILKTDPENMWFLDYQFHDFSMRGMPGKSAIVNSGLGFSTSSRGSDTLPVIPASRKYYGEKAVCINSVMASEHAIMCTITGFYLLNKKDGTWDKIGELELETFRYLLKKFPSGILSLVSDTWDLWRVVLEYCKALKEEILARDGKLVIRPDSGDPADIVCGLNTANRICSQKEPSYKGLIELLYEIFGGDTSSTGYKRLNAKIGAIYGDSITYQRAIDIFTRLASKGFASTNIVLGIGSYSLQGVTRDTHGFAQKATYVEIENIGIEIFKDPITDKDPKTGIGTKKSAKGLLMVYKDEKGEYKLKDQCTWDEVYSPLNEMKTIFKDGTFYNQTTLTDIRKRLINESDRTPTRILEAA